MKTGSGFPTKHLLHAGIIVVLAGAVILAVTEALHQSARVATIGRRPPSRVVAPDPTVLKPEAADAVVATHHSADPVLARFLDPLAGKARLAGDFAAKVPTITDPQDMEAVCRLLRDRSAALPLRNEAANLLRRSGCSQLTNELEGILDDGQELEDMRSYAAQHLGVSLAGTRDVAEHERLAARLALALDDRDRAVRREALLALVTVRDQRGLDQVMGGLASANWSHDRDLVIRCLYDLGRRDAIPSIRPFADDHDDAVRIAAVYVLGQWQDQASRSAFVRASHSATERIRRAGILALSTLDGPTVPALDGH